MNFKPHRHLNINLVVQKNYKTARNQDQFKKEFKLCNKFKNYERNYNELRTFFNRDNAFKMILFTSMLIMALYHFFFNAEYVSQITSFLGLLIFILSLLNIMVCVLEALIKNYDTVISYMDEEFVRNFPEFDDDIANDISRCIEKELYKEMNKYTDIGLCNVLFMKYWFLNNYRRKFRKIRRFILYFYFATITAILVFLFLSHEILPYIKNLDFGDWTILSFVIILFEILIKDEIVEGIYWSMDGILTKKRNKFIKNAEDENNG